MAEQHNVLNVINPAEGKRYKVTLRGDISALSARKLKRYLVASCGIDAHRQLLKYNGVELGDDVLAGEVGISSGATLTVERRASSSAPYVASPAKQALELETLDQQRELLGREHQRREDAFKKQQEALQASLALATDDAVPMVFLVASEGVYHNVGTSRYVTVALPDAAAFNPGGGGKA